MRSLCECGKMYFTGEAMCLECEKAEARAPQATPKGDYAKAMMQSIINAIDSGQMHISEFATRKHDLNDGIGIMQIDIQFVDNAEVEELSKRELLELR